MWKIENGKIQSHNILSPFLRSNINFEKQNLVVPLNLYGPIPMFKNFGDK